MMLRTKVILLIFVYFIIGAILIVIINKAKKDIVANKERWIKYAVYLIIVGSIVFTIMYTLYFQWITAGILIIAFGELIVVWKRFESRKLNTLLIGLGVLCIFSVGFFNFGDSERRLSDLKIYVLVFVFDGFSQLAGQLLGKHTFAGRISPNKTIEGLIGGYILTVITGFYLMDNYSILFVLTFSTIVCASALLGDLLASYYKRLHHAKDFGRSLPGHGGFLDRFDSFIAAGAIYWFVSKSTAYF